METIIGQIIDRLNRDLLFIRFDKEHSDELCFTIEYFSYFISCGLRSLNYMEKNEIENLAVYSISIKRDVFHNDYGLLTMGLFPERDFVGIAGVTKYLNSFIKLLPFTIVKYKQGQYRLLDPDGMDYIGEFVTFRDAKNTCGNNFIVR